MGPDAKDPWLRWAVFVVPAFATALSWRLTGGLPLVNRVAIAVAVGYPDLPGAAVYPAAVPDNRAAIPVAVALVVFGVVHVHVKGLPR